MTLAKNPTVILTSGTRGDMQPLVALGRGLHGRAIAVRFVTHAPFRTLVEGAGLPFAPLDGDLNQLLQPATVEGAFVVGGNGARGLVAAVRYLRHAQPVFARMIASAWQQCQGTRALILSLPTLWGVQIAEALDIPCACALLQPLSPTAAFPTPFLPWNSTVGAFNLRSHQLLLRALWLPWRSALARWRRDTLGLRSPLPPGPLAASMQRAIPWLYGISSRVLPRPADWPSTHQLTGYWFLDAAHGWQPPPALAAFLDHGSPPVYIGFGSMGGLSEDELRMMLAACDASGVRAVVAGVAPAALPRWAFALAPTPHDWLFPRVAAAIHHGGAGTTAAALRAGVPQVITPVAVDQHFWGQRVTALGVGPPACSRHQLSSDWLAGAIATARSAEMADAAATLGQGVRAERGVDVAVERLAVLIGLHQ